MTNYENAVNQLKTAKTVAQWNQIREDVKDTLTDVELNKIDSSGLITEVLGRD